jgi:hypothetical protein
MGVKTSAAAAAALFLALPVAADCDVRVLTIFRSLNANRVVYEAVLDGNGAIDRHHPLRVAWELMERGGRRDALNIFERGVYGYTVDTTPAGEVSVRLKARRSFPIRLRIVDGCPRALAEIDGREARLDRVWVQLEGGGFLTPKVSYLEVIGSDPETSEPVRERLTP